MKLKEGEAELEFETRATPTLTPLLKSVVPRLDPLIEAMTPASCGLGLGVRLQIGLPKEGLGLLERGSMCKPGRRR